MLISPHQLRQTATNNLGTSSSYRNDFRAMAIVRSLVYFNIAATEYH